MTLNIDNLCDKIHALRKLHALDEFVLGLSGGVDSVALFNIVFVFQILS